MNKRIRELADQILPNEKEFHQGDPKEWGYFFSGEELENFAELIVQECVRMCDVAEAGLLKDGLREESFGAIAVKQYINNRFDI